MCRIFPWATLISVAVSLIIHILRLSQIMLIDLLPNLNTRYRQWPPWMSIISHYLNFPTYSWNFLWLILSTVVTISKCDSALNFILVFSHFWLQKSVHRQSSLPKTPWKSCTWKRRQVNIVFTRQHFECYQHNFTFFPCS